MLTGNNDRKDGFGYREALTEVMAQLAVAEVRRAEAARAAQRTYWERRSLLIDERGLALAYGR